MGRARLLVRGRAGCEDSEVGVDLHRIGVDDRRAERLRQLERRGRLTARRRARNEKRPSQLLLQPAAPIRMTA